MKFLQKNLIQCCIGLVLVLILVSAASSLYNRHVMLRTAVVQEQSKQMKKWSESIFREIHLFMDISVRAFAVIHEDRFIVLTPENARKTAQDTFHKLDSLGTLQGYVDSSQNLSQLKVTFSAYIDLYEQMLETARKDSMQDFRQLLAQDQGKGVWVAWNRFNTHLGAYEDNLYQQAKADYETAMTSNVLIQVLLAIVGLPTLILLFYRLRQDGRKRHALLLKLQENNREYIFNDGDAAATPDDQVLIEASIANFKQALHFIKQLAAGDYGTHWDGLTEHNAPLNQHTLAGELTAMREQMGQLKRDEAQRVWAAEGITQFSELVRRHQQDTAQLYQQVIAFLVKYLNAQQGGLFVVQEEFGGRKWLDLAACYAFDRKKFIQRRVEVGQGLVGQAYLEAEPTVLTKLPPGYTLITSGLGDATPNCLLVMPARHNDQVEAVVELAGFVQYEAYQIAFVEKISEILASTVISAKTSEKMRQLLEESQAQAEEMRAQEEEMRQNMEELQATQEELVRKQREIKHDAN